VTNLQAEHEAGSLAGRSCPRSAASGQKRLASEPASFDDQRSRRDRVFVVVDIPFSPCLYASLGTIAPSSGVDLMTAFRRLLHGLLLASLAATSGCAIIGVAANAIPEPPIPASVVLANQSVGIMVWCDRGLRIDWPTLQKDLGAGVQTRILASQATKAKELENVTFPFPAESFVRWQKDHPGFEAEPITEVAKRLHVTRLIYIELDDLTTRTSQTMAMYRGQAAATVKVVAVEGGSSKIVHEEKISVHYPKRSTEEGSPDGNDEKIYIGTLVELADQIALRFVEHPADSE
jgi:hypothetical protein